MVRVRTLSCAPGRGDSPSTSLGVAGCSSDPGISAVNLAAEIGARTEMLVVRVPALVDRLAAFERSRPAPADDANDEETIGVNWRTGMETFLENDANARLPVEGTWVVVVGGGVVVCEFDGSSELR